MSDLRDESIIRNCFNVLLRARGKSTLLFLRRKIDVEGSSHSIYINIYLYSIFIIFERLTFTGAGDFIPKYVDLMNPSVFFEHLPQVIFVHRARHLPDEHLKVNKKTSVKCIICVYNIISYEIECVSKIQGTKQKGKKKWGKSKKGKLL